MATENFDVVIIGSGPGGYVAACKAGALGKTVACVENDRLGGVCLNWGCIPTKTLINDAHFYQQMLKQGDSFGVTVDPKKLGESWCKVVKRSRDVAAQLSKGIEFLFKKSNVKAYKGTAFIPKPGVVEVKDAQGQVVDTLNAKNILVCTGARNRDIPGIKPDGKRIITSREAMVLSELPKRLIVIGAGAIGIEFAYIYNSFGTQITVIEMQKQILPVEDEEVSIRLKSIFEKQGMTIHTQTRTDKVEVSESGVKVAVTDLDTNKQTVLEADKVLVAVGVTGNTEGLFAPAATPVIEKGHIKVDKSFQTNIPGIFAAGDVIGPPWLAHVASFESTIAVERMFNTSRREMDYTLVPGGTYCHPQVASVGLTERAAKEKGFDVEIGRYSFAASGKALAINAPEGFVKLLFAKPHGELLGAHIIGADATEMIAELVLAKRLEATKEEIWSTIHAHPTLSEAVMDAAAAVSGGVSH